MKERFISAFLIVSMICVALRGSTTSTYLRSQHRQLRADNNLTISAAQENGTIASSIPLEEATTMEEEVDNGTMVEGDKEVELPPNPSNASNATLLVDSSPPHDDDVNVTDDNMTNWMVTPVTLNSSLPIEETLMIEETNNTLTDELLNMSNLTNNTSSLTVTSSTLAPPQLNETTFEEEETLSLHNLTDTANVTNTSTIADLDLATFNATTSTPSTTPSSSTPTAAVAQTIVYSPTVNPTPPNGINTTTSAPTSTPTIAVQALNHTANPTIRVDSAAISSPPTIAPTIRSSTVNPTQQSNVPTLSNLDLDHATSSNSTSLMTSPEPTSQLTQEYDDDYDYNYDDDGLPWTYDGEPANITSPTPTSLPTYPPSTSVEANSTIYQIYFQEEVPTDSPSDTPTTHYPTYSPTTTRKGERVRKRRERRKENRRTAPTGSPTVVTKEFLEDVSASKTVGLVIGLILTIFGIGCCAWCV